MAEIHDLNVTDASNTARFPENMAPSAVNNSARALEGLVARYFFDNDTSVVATISASLITIVANRNSLTLTGTTSNYVANYMQAFTMGGNPNTGPVRVTVDGVGPISLRDNTGASLTSSVLLAGSRALMVKDGTNNYFRLIYPTVTSGYSDPLTTRGDILYRNSSNATARLAVGSANRFLKSDGTDVAWAALSGGKILQVVQATKTDTFTTTSTSFTDVTDVTVNITPAATSSKVLVLLTGFVGNSSTGNANAFLSLVRGSTEIFIGDAASNRVRASTIIGPSRSANGIAYGVSIAYVDSPSSTSAVTYKAQARIGGEGTMVVGRSGDDSDADNEGRVPTSIIVMEIGA